MNIESSEIVTPKLEYLLKTNLNRSLSYVFRTLRKDWRISHVADFPLLYFILSYGASREQIYRWRHSQIRRAMRNSEDLSGLHIPNEWKQFIAN